MSWRDGLTAMLLLSLAAEAFAGEGYILGGGLERDSENGLAATAMGELGLTDKTWLSAAIGRNWIDSGPQSGPDTWYADLGIDHWWDPIGIRAVAAYWGDNDTLDSTDWRFAAYWQAERSYFAADFEYRDFNFLLPATNLFQGRNVGFQANGLGATARFDVTDALSLGVSGMRYDYDINLGLDRNRGILQLLSFSRLSLINSLVDYRVVATAALDAGKRRWQFDIGSWKGEADGATTRSATVRFLTPLSEGSDIEFAIGVDDSELYGNVSYLSVFLYFYGGS